MPDEQQPAALRKAMEHFRNSKPEILQRWEQTVRQTLPAAWHTETLILRDHVPDFLEELAQAVLKGVQYEREDPDADVATKVAKTLASSVFSSIQHGAQRALLTDYSLGQLLHEYRILRKVSFDILDREAPLHPASREIINDAIDRSMELAAVEFTCVEQEALALSEAQCRLVMENVEGHAIFMICERGNILTWNIGAERLTGYSAADVLNKPLASLYADDAAWPFPGHEPQEISMPGGRPPAEGSWVRKDGTTFWASVVVTPLQDVPQRLSGFGVVARDISERRAREEANRTRADELSLLNQQKDDFLAMLAHELRNPLGAVSNAVHVMERASPGADSFERAQQSAKRQIRHQMRLVEDLLEASRLLRGKVEMQLDRLDLALLVRNAVQDYRGALESAQLSVQLDLPSEPVWVLGDPTRLAQVIGNLLQNSGKFTPAGGAVHVSLRGGDTASLTVRDSGIGLSPELFAVVFEPFSQADTSPGRRPGGLGLGLALVKGIVELHEGSVAVSSEGSGRGAEFTVVIPLAEGTADRGPFSDDVRTGAESRRIVIIDDSRDGAATLQDLLELLGHRVALAHSGPEGLRAAAETDAEIVLCDIGLPGMSGYEVAHALRNDAPPSLLVLAAMTGYGGDEDRRRSRAAGFDTHLTKPVDLPHLLELIASGSAL